MVKNTTPKDLPAKSEHGLNKKQLAFCMKYVENGGDYIEAYREAYSGKGLNDADLKFRAKKLLEQAKVQSFVWELNSAIGAGLSINRESMTEALAWGIMEARRNKDVNTLRQAVMDLAKLHGLIVDKADIQNNHNFNVMEQVTLDGDKLTFNIGQPVEEVERIRREATPKVTDVTYEDVLDGEDLL